MKEVRFEWGKKKIKLKIEGIACELYSKGRERRRFYYDNIFSKGNKKRTKSVF